MRRRARVPRYRWLLPQVHPGLQRHRRAAHRADQGQRRSSSGAEAQEAAFRKLKEAIASGPVLDAAGPQPAVRRAHRRVGLRRRCRAAAGSGQGPAADRLPVEEDAGRRDALPRARAGAARHHPCARARGATTCTAVKFKVMRTDHKSLQYFQTQPQLSGRQSRWKDVIANFDFDIEYVEGKDNVVADGLSRRRSRPRAALHSSKLLGRRAGSSRRRSAAASGQLQ